MLHRTLAATLIAALLAGPALAQDLRLYRADEAVDPGEVARILGSAPAGGFKTRSIRLLDDAPAAAAAPQPKAPAAELALPVQFAFDSAEILPAARGQLDALAAGIRLLPADKPVIIEGHTDASGSEPYNDRLSERRAQAVKQYLVAQHGISPARLNAVGAGEHSPLPGRDPHAAENRRVQFRGS